MLKLSKSITIAAPPEKVFDVINDSANLSEIWRNLSNIHNVKTLPNGGTSFEFDYSMAGIRVKGASLDLECVRPSRIVNQTTGGIVSTLTWVFKPLLNGAETNLLLGIEYVVPVPLMGRLAEIIIAKINEADIVYVLNYLKLKLEK